LRTIIAGSRTIVSIDVVRAAVSFCEWAPSVVVSGCAAGVDLLGEQWAKENGVPVEKFPADWKKFGKSAGPVRNGQMANVAEALIAVWDGSSSGTKNMIEQATKKGLKVSVFKVQKKSLRTWWFSSEKMTAFAECEDDVIVKTSPITKKFLNQHVKNLADWMRLQGGFEFKEITPGTENE